MAAKPIPWKYCECGCKGHTVEIGGAYFSYYTDLRGKHWLSTQHHAHLTGVEVATSAEADRRVRLAMKEQKKRVARQLSELEGV